MSGLKRAWLYDTIHQVTSFSSACTRVKEDDSTRYIFYRSARHSFITIIYIKEIGYTDEAFIIYAAHKIKRTSKLHAPQIEGQLKDTKLRYSLFPSDFGNLLIKANSAI